MAELACILLLIVFGALVVRSLTQYSITGAALRGELGRARDQLARQTERLSEARARQQDVEATIGLLEGERAALLDEEDRLKALERLAGERGPEQNGGKDG